MNPIFLNFKKIPLRNYLIIKSEERSKIKGGEKTDIRNS